MCRCWRCWEGIPGKSDRLCPECHEREVAKVHQHDTTDDYLDTSGVAYSGSFPPERFRLPHSAGRRVVRKSEPLAG